MNNKVKYKELKGARKEILYKWINYPKIKSV